MNNDILDLILSNNIYNIQILSKISQISKYYNKNIQKLWKFLNFTNSKYIDNISCSCHSMIIPNTNFKLICKHQKHIFISSINAIDEWFLEWNDLTNLSPYIFTNQIRLSLMYNKKDVIKLSIIKHTPKILNNKKKKNLKNKLS